MSNEKGERVSAPTIVCACSTSPRSAVCTAMSEPGIYNTGRQGALLKRYRTGPHSGGASGFILRSPGGLLAAAGGSSAANSSAIAA